MVENGFDVTMADRGGRAGLYFACEGKCLKIIQFLSSEYTKRESLGFSINYDHILDRIRANAEGGLISLLHKIFEIDEDDNALYNDESCDWTCSTLLQCIVTILESIPKCHDVGFYEDKDVRDDMRIRVVEIAKRRKEET